MCNPCAPWFFLGSTRKTLRTRLAKLHVCADPADTTKAAFPVTTGKAAFVRIVDYGEATPAARSPPAFNLPANTIASRTAFADAVDPARASAPSTGPTRGGRSRPEE